MPLPQGYIIGHEPMGIVEEVSRCYESEKGDRVVIPFNVACGHCFIANMKWKVNVTTPTPLRFWRILWLYREIW